MNLPESSSGGYPNPSKKKEIQLQGPRPPQLRVSQESRKIKKPPAYPPPAFPPASRPPLPPQATKYPQPLIIYDISPKVIHVAENNFMSVVQRLTGLSSSSLITGESSGAGDLSPAARLATIEKASPRSERELDVSDMMDMVEVSVELGPAPGILSPAPSSLPQIPAGFFSPVSELSPYWHNSFMASPSGFLSAASPISSPNIFNSLFDL